MSLDLEFLPSAIESDAEDAHPECQRPRKFTSRSQSDFPTRITAENCPPFRFTCQYFGTLWFCYTIIIIFKQFVNRLITNTCGYFGGVHYVVVSNREEYVQEAYDILRMSPAVIFLWQNKETWPVKFVTENVLDLFGYSVEEWLNGDIAYSTTIHPEDLRRVADEVSRFSSNPSRRSFYHEPYRILTKDGQVKWVDDCTVVRRNQDGEITHYQGIVIDITERIKAENEVRQSEERLDMALKGADLGVWDWNAEDDEMVFSVRWADILGFELSELEPNYATWESLIHPDDLHTVEKIWADHVDGFTPFYSSQHRMRTKSGEYKWVLERGKVQEWDEKGGTRRAAGTLLDITDRVLAEQARRESEAKYRTLVEQSIMGIAIITRGNPRFAFANQRLAQILGRTVDELIHMSPDEVADLVHTDDQDDILQYLKDILYQEETPKQIQVRAFHSNGSIRWLELSSSRVEYLDDVAVQMTISDITERHQALDSLQRERTALL